MNEIKAAEQDGWSRRLGVAGLMLDLFMVGLAIFSLALLIFDSMWMVPEVRSMMGWVLPMSWLDAYAVVNQHFFRIDLVIISIFLAEFLSRWAWSVWSRTHARWYAYPILHWYDLLGCIPSAGLRWLRVLRIFAMLVRLQNLGLIDYTGWRVYRWTAGIYDIVMEEISDRVVLRVLNGVQDEISSSNELEKRMLQQVVIPRQASIADALHQRITRITQHTYRATREDLHSYVKSVVSRAVRENREIRTIDRIPVVGGVASDLLDHAITDIVCRVIDELADEIDGPQFEALFVDVVDGLVEGLVESADSENDPFSVAIIDSIEVIKAQVAKRRWLEPAKPANAPTAGSP